MASRAGRELQPPDHDGGGAALLSGPGQRETIQGTRAMDLLADAQPQWLLAGAALLLATLAFLRLLFGSGRGASGRHPRSRGHLWWAGCCGS
jgi:hypothetical protein